MVKVNQVSQTLTNTIDREIDVQNLNLHPNLQGIKKEEQIPLLIYFINKNYFAEVKFFFSLIRADLPVLSLK